MKSRLHLAARRRLTMCCGGVFSDADLGTCGKLVEVKYYLIVFDQANHRIVELEEFDNSTDAVRERFKREIEHSERGCEVVVLGAASKEALENTHSRYFGGGRELASA